MKLKIKPVTESLVKESKYSCCPSFEDYGFGSMTNTEAFEAAEAVSKYFSDYAKYLKTEAEPDNADKSIVNEFEELASNLNRSLYTIVRYWDENQ